MTVKIESNQHWLTLIRFVSLPCFNSKAMPTDTADYSCHIKHCRTCFVNHIGSCHTTSY